jgi:release factor glutamine methyltransferase
MTVQQAYQKALYSLSSLYEASEAQAIVLRLFEPITGSQRLPTPGQMDLELSVYHQLLLDKQLQELQTYKPLQYVLNEAWFMGHSFYVDPRVLIPRPETEELVAWVLQDHPNVTGRAYKVLDIGTGSGCIAISLQLARNYWEVSAIDISGEALEVAAHNAQELGAMIKFDQQDISADPATFPHSGYSLIISNPPYIPSSLKGTLAPQVEGFEPVSALFVQSEDPLFFYRCIARFGQVHLEPQGLVYVEAHHDGGADVAALLSKSGYIDVEVRKDMQGIERLVKGKWAG